MQQFLAWCIVLLAVGIINGEHRNPHRGLTGKFILKDVCPKFKCGFGAFIPKECRKPQFMLGLDGQTRCRMCDESFCGDKAEVCPLMKCPDSGLIEPECRKPNYIIGADGITRCRACDSNACGDPKDVCPPTQKLCPLEHTIPVECRVNQYVIGSDGITLCKVCSKNVCKGRRDLINLLH